MQDASGRGNPGTISGRGAASAGRFGGRAVVRRGERLGDGRRLRLARPDHGNDDRGLGAPDGPVDDLAHGGCSRSGSPASWSTRCTRTRTPPGRAVTCSRPGVRAARPGGARRSDTWTHLATTWDGTDAAAVRQRHAGGQRARVTGTAAERRPSPCGSAATPSGAEWFAGLIDEVRVYNRALSAAEIQADSDTPIGSVATVAHARLPLLPTAGPPIAERPRSAPASWPAGVPCRAPRGTSRAG